MQPDGTSLTFFLRSGGTVSGKFTVNVSVVSGSESSLVCLEWGGQQRGLPLIDRQRHRMSSPSRVNSHPPHSGSFLWRRGWLWRGAHNKCHQCLFENGYVSVAASASIWLKHVAVFEMGQIDSAFVFKTDQQPTNAVFVIDGVTFHFECAVSCLAFRTTLL